MSDAKVERVIQEIKSMSSDQLEEVRRAVDEKLSEETLDNKQTNGGKIELPFKPRFIGYSTKPPKDRSRENAWLEKHRDEYDGQWVALDGDRLLAHGYEFKDVIAAARNAGVMDALVFIVEGSEAPPFAGF